MSDRDVEPREGAEPDDRPATEADHGRALQVLEQAVGRGVLDLDGYSDRVDAVLAAGTWAEIEAVVSDVPGCSLREPVVPDPPALALETTSGSLAREGEWTVPREISARCRSGRVLIDFTRATCRHEEIRLTAVCGSGRVELLVPRGWLVRVEELRVRSGRVVDTTDQQRAPGCPLVRVSGELGSGRITINHPRR